MADRPTRRRSRTLTPRCGREIKVKIAADVRPVPPNGLLAALEFDGLQVIPYLDFNRVKPCVAIADQAAGRHETQNHFS